MTPSDEELLNEDNPAFCRSDYTAPGLYPGCSDEPPTFDRELACEYSPALEDAGQPERGYRERWRAIARMHALGQTNTKIAASLGYTQPAISLALKDPWVQSEVRRFREQYESDIMAKVKEAALDGIDRIHSIILDEKEKSAVVLDASKWAVEKTTGKARQEVSVENGSLNQFMEILREMRARKEVVDVTPQVLAAPAQDSKEAPLQLNDWSTWLDQNL